MPSSSSPPASSSSSSSAALPLLFGRPRVLSLGGRGSSSSIPLPRPSSIKPSSSSSSDKKEKEHREEEEGNQHKNNNKGTKRIVWGRHAHGSYKYYYGARRPPKRKVGEEEEGGGGNVGTGEEKDEVDDDNEGCDVRLSLLQEAWFRDLDYLDIGTNTGKVAWEIYRRFKPKSVLGIDIDNELIQSAKEKLSCASQRDGIEYGNHVTFRCEDFVAPVAAAATASTASREKEEKEKDDDDEDKKFHVITCLSVVKHIHLQGGDTAVQNLFHRIHHLLHPGGRFIFEPQSWKSYRKRKHASAESMHHFHSIQMRPHVFPTYLLEEVGFEAMEELGIPPLAPQGFRRPMYCFVKKKKEVEEG